MWVKSTFSNPSGNCVEIEKVWWNDASGRIVNGQPLQHHLKWDIDDQEPRHAALYLMRDSKNPGGHVLVFDPNEIEAFLLGVKNDEFDPETLP